MLTRKKNRIVSILIIAGALLCLNGCVNIHFGLSDYYYDNSEKYTVGGGAELSDVVEDIEIDWIKGDVKVMSHDSDEISFSEESAKELTEDMRMRYWKDGTTLKIKFCASGRLNLNGPSKKLTVLVPRALVLKELQVDVVSADVCIDTVKAKKVEIDTISGDIDIASCTVGELVEIDSVSGKTEAELLEPLKEFNGSSTSGSFKVSAPSVSRFTVDSVSGEVDLSVEKEPEKLNIDTTSSDIELILPENASFRLDFDSVSGDMYSDLPHTSEGGRYSFGDGTNDYEIDTVSGDVRITAYNLEK